MNAPVALPANISIANARLPATYEAAKTALANCANLDECVDWSNKADALASYAKQAEDESLHRFATRIRARAIRRAGELLKTFDGSTRNQEGGAGTHTTSQRHAAEAAGMSKHQQHQAVRVANVPAETFDDWIDSDDPPTIVRRQALDPRSDEVSAVETDIARIKTALGLTDAPGDGGGQ